MENYYRYDISLIETTGEGGEKFLMVIMMGMIQMMMTKTLLPSKDMRQLYHIPLIDK